MKTALITGVLGMDGMYLACYLAKLNYRVIGLIRRTTNTNSYRLGILQSNTNFVAVDGDITDPVSIANIIKKYKPDELYNLAANSFVGCSWETPNHVMTTNAMGQINCLEAVRQYCKECRVYFAASSEMFGDVAARSGVKSLNENSPMEPASPYGLSKLAGFHITKIYRESYGLFACSGILFNHSSLLRGKEFFTRKVTSTLAAILHGQSDKLKLGNLSALRDEGDSKSYVRAMHKMLSQASPKDYVISSGKYISCKDWLQCALSFLGLNDSVFEIQQSLIRPNEVNFLCGDSSSAQRDLNWKYTQSAQDLCTRMCTYDELLLTKPISADKMLKKDLYGD